ncbi:hypothetical protein HY251_03235, partial [bacterium]|nr:hypothetical protein [bacterium]
MTGSSSGASVTITYTTAVPGLLVETVPKGSPVTVKPVTTTVDPLGFLICVEGTAVFSERIFDASGAAPLEGATVTFTPNDPSLAVVSAGTVVTGPDGVATFVYVGAAPSSSEGASSFTVTASPPPGFTVFPPLGSVTVMGTVFEITSVALSPAPTATPFASGTLITATFVTTPTLSPFTTVPASGALVRYGTLASLTSAPTFFPHGFSVAIFSPGEYQIAAACSAQPPTFSPFFTVKPDSILVSGAPDCIERNKTVSLSAFGIALGVFAYDDLPFAWDVSPASLGSIAPATGSPVTLTGGDPGPKGFLPATIATTLYGSSVPTAIKVELDVESLLLLPTGADIDPLEKMSFTVSAKLKDGTSRDVDATWTLEGTPTFGSLDTTTGPKVLLTTARTTSHLRGRVDAHLELCDVSFVAVSDVDICYDFSDITVSPSSSSIPKGATVAFSAVGDTGVKLAVADWSVSPVGSDTVSAGTIDATTGLYVAPVTSATAILSVTAARCNDPVGASFRKDFLLTVTVSGGEKVDLTPLRTAGADGSNTNESANAPSTACESTGEVFLHNGEEFMSFSDLFVRGRGEIDFNLQRMYRSRLRFDGPIGQGWDFNYNEHLVVQPSGGVLHVNGFGRADSYARQTDGSFKAPSEFFRVLKKESDGSYVLRDARGFKRRFDASGNLTAHEDRNHNQMTFTYSAGQLEKAFDPFGRVYTFAWRTDGRLESVTDFAGRECSYAYNDAHDLIAVTSPAITGTSTGNDFPFGRTTKFTYSSGFSDEDLNHNLLTMTDAQGVAVSGPPRIVIAYGTDPSSPLTYDKVVSITKGGTNESGVPAGGLWTFKYEPITDPSKEERASPAIRKTTVTDPVGNVSVYSIDAQARTTVVQLKTRGIRPGEPDCFCTILEYNSDSLVTKATHPLETRDEFTYDSGSASRFSQANLLEVRRIPDAARGGGEPLVTRFSYEPLFNQLASVTDAREFSSSYKPAIGLNAPGRFTTRFFFDYQEGTAPVAEATKYGIGLSSVPRGLGDLNGDGRTDQVAGNVVLVRAPPVTLLAGSNEALARGTTVQKIETQLAWNDAGEPLLTIDPEGNLSTASYHPENDPDGDGVPVPGNSSTLPRGYLKTATRDAGTTPRRSTTATPAVIVVSFVYDPLGRVTSIVNGRGVATRFEWNALDELVSTASASDVSLARSNGQLLLDGQAFAYVTRRFFDANGRVTKIQTENRDGNAPELGPYIERTFQYDMLDELIVASARVDASTVLTTKFSYTGNELLELVTRPEGNKTRTVYDERNLVFKVTRGFGSTGAAPSTVTFNYDQNAGLFEILDPEHTRTDGAPARTTLGRDGFDRVTTVTDAIGGQVVVAYDPVSAGVKRQFFGPPAGKPAAPITLRAE